MLIFAEINKQENLLTSKQTLIMALLGFSDSSYKKVPYLILTQDLFYISLDIPKEFSAELCKPLKLLLKKASVTTSNLSRYLRIPNSISSSSSLPSRSISATALPSGSIQDTDTVLAVILITKKRSGQPKNFITCLLFIETHLDGSVVIPWVVIKDHGLKDYARLKSYERPLKITRQLVQLLAICYGTPTKRPVSKCPVTKTPIFKTSNHKTTIIKTAINKMSVYKTSIYKTAVYKMSVYKISLLVNITNCPF